MAVEDSENGWRYFVVATGQEVTGAVREAAAELARKELVFGLAKYDPGTDTISMDVHLVDRKRR